MMNRKVPEFRVVKKVALDGKEWFVVEMYSVIYGKWAFKSKHKRKMDAYLYMDQMKKDYADYLGVGCNAK